MSNNSIYTAGVDIGGTNLRLGIFGGGGKPESDVRILMPEAADVDFIIRNIKKFLYDNKKYNVKTLGIGIAGQIDAESGNIIFSPNLNWHNVPLKKGLEEELGLNNILVANDLAAITYGEWKYGAGKGFNNLICIFVGTGIGSGIIINGGLYTGCFNSAGEIGHTRIVSGGRKCTCGNYGCLEAYAGGHGIASIAIERAYADRPAFQDVINESGGVIESITAKSIAKAYKAGSKEAVRLIKETGEYLSDGVASAVNLLSPCAVILGGGVLDGIPELFDIVRAETLKRSLKASSSNLKILRSSLGEYAGIIGAAALSSSV
ncbi:MAG: ROK family protein [Deltaproteobacteria bacterium]|jgi:glucokinase|uniref:ROK family protein n=1 Tax=Candidatus Acidulodesulfobacterium acidiphilum TaxID=2597224 RepID=A0A520XBL1_9DELT|nr:ROK family protein [Deltaproteobacteria bacterium]MDA8299386.1 ROK family protein [Deltaproteobacteria bacterium]RZV38518.1 MAG: ROK family protein [Candidatus Acidulodesulfobacterium acidiphilum]